MDSLFKPDASAQFFASTGRPGSPDVAAFYEPDTGSWQYVLSDPASAQAAIVDPVLEFDPASGATWTGSAERILAYLTKQGLTVAWILDTHPHADHFSAAHFLKQRLGAPQAIGRGTLEVQRIWADLYADDTLAGQPGHWDRLFDEGDRFEVGGLGVEVWHSPGHTLASITYVVGDTVFAHDTLMVPDSGSSRADFPGGDAGQLHDSITRILDLPGDTRIFVGHDYCKDGRDPACMATVAEHWAENIHFQTKPSRDEFIHVRGERDATLALPDRMLAALQINIRGGRLPEPDAQGRRVLRLPLDRFDREGRLKPLP
ncbi:MAG TPA: MBL fold metallo-hydrolase [Thermohalobaculum sp.]|nr:MBL fold metallo-hydrolase [Thermohalobaculum sp.]